jgi:Fe-S-cluster containining protein
MGPCATCWSSCCRLPGPVGVTAADVARLGDLARHVLPPDDPSSRFAGQLAKLADNACVFLRDDGCAVHEIKPEICRQFDAATCGMFVPDAEKESGRLRLRVLEPER